MTKLSFTRLLAGAALLAAPSCLSRPHRLTVELRPASSEEVELWVRGGGRLRFHASANGLRTGARGLGFTAPGTLEIAGGDGQLEVSAADTAQRFVMIVKRDVAGVTRELETRGPWAMIRMRDGKIDIQTESMTMRDVRRP